MWFFGSKKSSSKHPKYIYISASELNMDGNPYVGNDKVEAFVVDPGNNCYCSKDGYLCKKKICSLGNPNTIIEGYHIVAATNMYSEYQMTKDIFVVGKQAFKKSKIETVGMSPSLYRIKSEAFCDCKNLQNVDFYFSTRKNIVIESRAFANCTSLESIVLPVYLSKISGDAFRGCDSLAEIRMLSALPPLITDYSWMHPRLGIPNKNLKLLVPKCAVEAYKKAEGWKDFDIYGEDIPNMDLYLYCLQDKNASTYKDLPYESFPISLKASEKEISVVFHADDRGKRFDKIYVDLKTLLGNLYAASHEILVNRDGVSRGALFEKIEIVSIEGDVVWYTEKWGMQNPRQIFRFERSAYEEQIRNVVLNFLSCCERHPSAMLYPSDLFTFEEIKQLVINIGWLQR
jgi:hypothetical protein